LLPEGLCTPVMRFTEGLREITRGELAMSAHELTDCILKGFAGTGRPDQEPDQAVAHDTQRSFLAANYNCLKIVERVGAASECEERYRESSNVPEIPSGSTKHHVGAEAGKDAHANQEQPAILREQSNKSEGHETPQKRPR